MAFTGKSNGVGCHCLLHFCTLETGNGDMLGEDTVKDTCRWGAPQITKNLKFSSFQHDLQIPFIYLRLGSYSGEGNGILLQYSCLENPMGGGAW